MAKAPREREESPDPFPGEAGKPPELQSWRFTPSLGTIPQTKDALTLDQERVEERTKMLWSREREFWSRVTTTLKIGGSLGKLWAEGKEYDKTETNTGKEAGSRRKIAKSPTMKDLALPASLHSVHQSKKDVKQRLSKLHGPAFMNDDNFSLSKTGKASAGESYSREEVVMWDPKARNILGPKFHKFSDHAKDYLNSDQFMVLLKECRLIDKGFSEDDAQQLFQFVVRRNAVQQTPNEHLGQLQNSIPANCVNYADFEALMMRIAEIKGGYVFIAEGCAHDSEKDIFGNPRTRQKLLDIYNNLAGTSTAELPSVGTTKDISQKTRPSDSASACSSEDEGVGQLTLHDFVNLCHRYRLFHKRWTIADVYALYAGFAEGTHHGLTFTQFLHALDAMAQRRGLTSEMLLYSADGLLVCLPEPVGKVVYKPDGEGGDFEHDLVVNAPTVRSSISAAAATIGYIGGIEEGEEEVSPR